MMFIPNEFLDEEVFPAAFFLILSVSEDLEKCRAGFSEVEIFEKIVAAVCLSNNFQLKKLRITAKNLYLIVSKNRDLKKKDNLIDLRTDVVTLSTNILEKADRSGELYAFYELWDVREVEEAVRFFENISKENAMIQIEIESRSLSKVNSV